MKIALMHFRVYETDGVSLEMDKWKIALEKLGHEVIYISGSPARNKDIYVDFLDYKSEYNEIIHKNAFDSCSSFETEVELLDFIDQHSEKIYNKLKRLIIFNSIDLLVPNNISSLGYNIPVGIAVARIAKENITEIMYHHHDFYWERKRYNNPVFKPIKEYLNKYFPYPYNAKHCVINHIAKAELLKRKNINSSVIPNVFDFNQPLFELDEYNKDLRKILNIKEDDIVFLQATRIVERKAIELGFNVIKEVSNNLKDYIGKTLYNGYSINKDTKIHFILAGMNEYSSNDFKILNDLLNSSNVIIHYTNDIVSHKRIIKNNKSIYSLWDFYAISDFITYTSILEGWGNQLLEGIFAKKPMIIYEYPVYKTDIKQYNFNLVTIDSKLTKDNKTGLLKVSKEITKEKALEVINILLDKKVYNSLVEKNFIIGEKHLSYTKLTQLLKELVDQI